MTAAEIKEYEDAIGRGIRLFGYTSTSLKKNQAESFAWENSTSGHQKVLFHIKWSNNTSHYYLNAGAYDQEEEILFTDGVQMKVISVEEAKDQKGKPIYTLITL